MPSHECVGVRYIVVTKMGETGLAGKRARHISLLQKVGNFCNKLDNFLTVKTSVVIFENGIESRFKE